MTRDKDAELRDEIALHLEMAVEDRIARGETPRDAVAAAKRELGNISQIQEATRDVWGRRWIEQAAQDVRYALRTFRRNPAFAAVAILSLTLGIGANTALFEVVNAVRLRALPIADPSRLVEVRIADMNGARGGFETWYPAVTQPIWRELEARQEAFSGLFAWSQQSFNLSSGGETRLAEGLWVTRGFFDTLGVRPSVGRLLPADDDRPGCAPRAVLGNGFWHRAYAADPTVVGRTIVLDSRPVEIVGVAPPGFHGLEVGRAFDVALPLCAEPVFSDDGKGRADAGTTWWLSIFGRLKSGWSPERATAHLNAISPAVFRASLPAEYPVASVQRYLEFRFGAYPGGSGLSQLREAYGEPLWLLLAIAGLVLVIACANLANLLLARATAREREFAVRLGLGASRARVVRQLLTESLLLVSIGATGALFLAGTLGQWLITALATADNPITLPLGADWSVLVFACALALATCLLFGLAPALRGTRVPAGAMVTIMREAPRGATSGRHALSLRRALVVTQVALSVALLFGALLFARTLRNVLSVNPGFRAEGVVAAELDLTALGTPPERRRSVRQDLLERVRAMPGVRSAAFAAVVPMSGDASGNDVWPEGDRTARFNMLRNTVGTRFFETLEIPIVAGRDFDDRDSESSVAVAIVNETFAGRMGGSVVAVGRRFTREATPSEPEVTYEIVGVVRNSSYRSLKEEPYPVVFLADTQRAAPPYARLIVRSTLPPASTTAAVTAALANLDRRIEVGYAVLPTMIRDTLVQDRLLAGLAGGFGGLAAALTMAGLYGLITYSVARRTGEIGIRMALGATGSNIARLLLRETGVLLAVGAAFGIGLAIAGGRSAAALLFGITPNDPATLGVAVALLCMIGLAASYAPARRAARIDPVVALRAD
jgi:putative ABC transport system permease protein